MSLIENCEELVDNLQCQQTVRGMDLSRVVAPMVNQSDAPFRVLCMKYGATAAYTEMLYAERIALEDSYLENAIPLADETAFANYKTRPLICQLCGNDEQIMAAAAAKIKLCKIKIDAIDFNLGCPQDRAKEGLYGAYFTDKKYWPRVFACVKAMKAKLNGSIPIFCKIRIQEGNMLKDTLDFISGLASNGAEMITIHGRTRGSTKFRRRGPADQEIIKALANKSPVPIVLNGNIVTRNDVSDLLDDNSFPCIGIMSAEGILADPGLFSNHICIAHPDMKKTNSLAVPDRSHLFEEYVELSDLYAEKFGWECVSRTHPYNANAFSFQCNNDEVTRSCQGKEKQLSTARQHLGYMLGKTGSGRSVKFLYKGSYAKPTILLNAIKEAKCLKELICIAKDCLKGVQGSLSYQLQCNQFSY